MGVISISSIVAILSSHKKHKSLSPSPSSSSSSSSSIKNGKNNSMSAPKRLVSKLNSNVSDKAHLIAKMISWKKTPSEDQMHDDEEEEEEEEALWRKTIMKGERCRPLDFSGQILYDSQGNLLKV